MVRYLVVANQTLGGEELLTKIRECMEAEPTTFHVVVPATHPIDHASWTEGHALAIASSRLEEALERFRDAGAEVTGEIGDANPIQAIRDVCLADRFDGIILSTLPAGPSRWLKQDLPHRVERTFTLPVIHVTGTFART